MEFKLRPVVLSSAVVRLEPLEAGHAEDLFEAGADPDIWRYMTRRPFRDLDDVREYIEAARSQAAGVQLAFAIVPSDTGRAAGSTRFFDVRPEHRGLEIGHTWITATARGGVINRECKRLLMEHAFERLGANRVQLKTDARNLRAQRSMEKLGLTREGTLRRHLVLPDGFCRDSVFYSAIADEWPSMKASLAISSGGDQAS